MLGSYFIEKKNQIKFAKAEKQQNIQNAIYIICFDDNIQYNIKHH